MLKKLLFSLIGIVSLQPAFALGGDSEGNVITDPPGRREVYCQAYRIAGIDSELPWSYGNKNEIVWDGETDVYLFRPLCERLIPNDYYLHGTKSGDNITVSLPQLISTSGKVAKYIWAMLPDAINRTYTTQGAPRNVSFSVAADGSISMNAQAGVVLAMGDVDGNFLAVDGYHTGATELVYHPANMVVSSPADDAQIGKWWMKSEMLSGVPHDAYVNVAIAGNELYVQGISVQHPQAWIKGAINEADGSYTVTFPNAQFAGWNEDSNQLSYFYGYTYDGQFDADARIHRQTNAHLMPSTTPIIFDFDPQTKVLSAREGQGLTINNDARFENMFESFGYMSISRNGAVFKSNVPWNTGEVEMTFKVLDEDAKLCQVGNGNIPVDIDDLRGQAIDNIYTGIIKVPETVNGYSVVRVGRGAFEQMQGVTSVVLPNSVEQIDEHAFYFNKAMTEFQFPANLKVIKDYAFFCSGINSISLDKVSEVGEAAFSGCDNLTEVIWPGNLAVIPVSAFEECANLTKVSIADGVTEIGNLAFAFCNRLKDIDLSKSTTLTNIGRFAFKCADISTLIIPAGVQTIGHGAFAVLPKLATLYVHAQVPPVVEERQDSDLGAFSSVHENCVLYVPKGCVESYSSQKPWNEFLTKGGIKEDVNTGIEDITSDNESGKSNLWFTLDGKKLQGKPSAPGIYLNGKTKVIISF